MSSIPKLIESSGLLRHELPGSPRERGDLLLRFRFHVKAREWLRARLSNQNPRTALQHQLDSVDGIDRLDAFSSHGFGRGRLQRAQPLLLARREREIHA